MHIQRYFSPYRCVPYPRPNLRIRVCIAGLVVCMPITSGALAQSFPTKPVRMIVPFTAGSNIDIIARPVGQKLSEIWGQSVVIENRPGAGGTLGAGLVAKSQPDGYTVLLNSSAQAINPSLYASLPYEHTRDFVEIAALVSQPYVLVVGPTADTAPVTVCEKLAEDAA